MKGRLENGEKHWEVDLRGSLDFVLPRLPRLWEKSRDPGFPNSSTPGSSRRRGGRQDIWGWYGKEKSYAALFISHLKIGEF